MKLSRWLAWFTAIALEAQTSTIATVEFLVEKTKLPDHLRGRINERQTKALLRMFKEGPRCFAGGMSVGKYSTITDASSATATRDLNELVALEALTRHWRTEAHVIGFVLRLPLRVAEDDTRTAERELRTSRTGPHQPTVGFFPHPLLPR